MPKPFLYKERDVLLCFQLMMSLSGCWSSIVCLHCLVQPALPPTTLTGSYDSCYKQASRRRRGKWRVVFKSDTLYFSPHLFFGFVYLDENLFLRLHLFVSIVVIFFLRKPVLCLFFHIVLICYSLYWFFSVFFCRDPCEPRPSCHFVDARRCWARMCSCG